MKRGRSDQFEAHRRKYAKKRKLAFYASRRRERERGLRRAA